MDWVVTEVAGGLLLLDLLLHAVVIWYALPIFERKLPLQAVRIPPDETAEAIDFPTSEGLTLHGCLFWPLTSKVRGIVLFCPEFGSDRWSARAYAEGLWAEGFVICSFDFRNQGESPRMPGYEPLHWPTEFEVVDVLSAIAYLKGRSDLRDLPLGLLGVSRGASAALAAAARTPAVQCVVSDGAFSVSTLLVDFARRWGQLYLPAAMLRCVPLWHVRLTIQLMKWISQARRGCVYSNLERGLRRLQSKPVLMISGESDNYVSPEITRGLQRLTRQDAGGGAWIAPKARHNLARQVNSETYDRLLVAFFSQMQMPTPTARALAGGDSPVAVKRGEQAISA